ncbi:alpha/beta fold hydrolase [Dactylosporangium sp. McL0621]|uniref:alpha/beta fold hydrolase n=1 Tax=Dactylosporangium sp. McL0621 TaxID=3415678 RepID=UPI003CF68B78
MTTYALIPGAGGDAWYWHRVQPILEAAGHRAVAAEIPGDDPAAGWEEYAKAVTDAIPPSPGDLVVVGQSMGGFTAPVVAERLGARHIVLLNAMIPRPGETGGAWWDNVGQGDAARAYAVEQGRDPDAEFDLRTAFFHDVPEDVTEQAMTGGKQQADTPFGQPWLLDAWPDVPTTVLAGADDRLFPAGFQARVARERLELPATVLPGGHLIALSRPDAVASALLAV